jgi:Leucine-rich repeat (LRR) protein
MPVIIARRRAQKVGEKPDEALRNAIRRALGSGQLDLKSFRLNTIPMDLFNTLSLQLGRFIKIMNLSRNELREFPGELCESFLGLETIFCKDNQLLHLPNAMIRLEKLKKLVAECNQLIDVPQHLPLTLNYMSLSRNRLHAIPNLFELIHLTDLDLSHNLFKVLPPAMFLLQKLKRLNLSGNKLISLAVFRKDRTREIAERKQAEQKEQNPREEFKKWRVEVDPGTGESIYFHLEKKEVSRSKPKCFLEVEALEQAFEPQDIHPDVPRLQLGAIDGKSINKAASAPKIQDESLYSDGWEIIEKPHPMRYIDHNSNQTYFSIPPALDRLGALDHIEYLFMSGNELEELPPSIVSYTLSLEEMIELNLLLFREDYFVSSV